MALEAAMADMMKDVQGVLDTAKETKAELNKVAKSREFEIAATWPRRRTRGTSSARRRARRGSTSRCTTTPP